MRVVSTADSIAVPAPPPSGAQLRDEFSAAIRALTFGLVRLRGNSLALGPIELIRFGPPTVTSTSVEWPIDGGLLSARKGGTWRIGTSDRLVEAALSGWTSRLPRLVYAATQLQVHLLFTRLYLLRVRGRAAPAQREWASRRERRQAAAIDLALCLMLVDLTRPRRLRRLLGVAAAYHVACWSTTGRTLGGLVMRQRVVAVDGSRLTPTQAMLRLVLAPASWITGRPLHDELAASDVIKD